MKTAALRLHILSVAIALCAFGAQYVFGRPSPHVHMPEIVLTLTQRVFAAVGSVTGVGLMATRSGKSESVLLGLSTVGALCLLLIATLYSRV